MSLKHLLYNFLSTNSAKNIKIRKYSCNTIENYGYAFGLKKNTIQNKNKNTFHFSRVKSEILIQIHFISVKKGQKGHTVKVIPD